MTVPPKVLAWHWIKADGTLRDGTPMVVGETVRFTGPLRICQQGLHASRNPLHALNYAPGPVVCRVECDGIGEEHSDKFVCAERTVLWSYNATVVLRQFARRVALDVAHLWAMPDVVRRYLATGDEGLRVAARKAASAASAAYDAYYAADAAAFAADAAAYAADAAAYVADAAAFVADAYDARTKYAGWLEEMLTTAAPKTGGDA